MNRDRCEQQLKDSKPTRQRRDDMGQQYAHQKTVTSQAQHSGYGNLAHVDEDAQRLYEAESLQKKLDMESQKIIQVHTQFKVELKMKEEAMTDAVKTVEKQKNEILQLQRSNEHLVLELESEMKNRESLVQNINNSHEIHKALAEHFEHIKTRMLNIGKIEADLEKRDGAVNDRVLRLKADYESLSEKYETERAHLRSLVTEERDNRVRDIHAHNARIQEAETRVNDLTAQLRDLRGSELHHVRVIESNGREIDELKAAAAELKTMYEHKERQLTAAVEQARSDNDGLRMQIERLHSVELDYHKLVSQSEALQKEKEAVYQQLQTTETSLQAVRAEKREALESLETAGATIKLSEEEKAQMLRQLEAAQAFIEEIRQRKDEIVAKLESAEATVKAIEVDREDKLARLSAALSNIESIESDRDEISRQLGSAERSIKSAAEEKTVVQSHLDLARSSIEMFERNTEDLLRKLAEAGEARAAAEGEKAGLEEQLLSTNIMFRAAENEKAEIVRRLEAAEQTIATVTVEKETIVQRLDVTGTEYADVLVKVKEVEAALEEERAELAQVTEQLRQSETCIDLLEQDKFSARKELSCALDTIASYEQVCATSRDELAASEAAARELRDRCEALTGQLDKAAREREALRSDLEQAAHEKEEALQANDEMREEFGRDAEAKRVQYEQFIQEAEGERDSNMRCAITAENRNVVYEKRIDEAEAELERERRDSAHLRAKLAGIEGAVTALEVEKVTATEEARRMEGEVRKMEGLVRLAEKEKEVLELKIMGMVEGVAEAKEGVDQLKSKKKKEIEDLNAKLADAASVATAMEERCATLEKAKVELEATIEKAAHTKREERKYIAHVSAAFKDKIASLQKDVANANAKNQALKKDFANYKMKKPQTPSPGMPGKSCLKPSTSPMYAPGKKKVVFDASESSDESVKIVSTTKPQQQPDQGIVGHKKRSSSGTKALTSSANKKVCLSPVTSDPAGISPKTNQFAPQPLKSLSTKSRTRSHKQKPVPVPKPVPNDENDPYEFNED